MDTGGAGDQGTMIGYACSETPEFMPLPIMLAHKLSLRLVEVRKKQILKFLGPDGKSQVSVEYRNGEPKRVDSVVIACQHTEEIVDKSGKKITNKARRQIIKAVIDPVLAEWIDNDTRFYINETGKFIISGPQSDTGMTGRKIIVDTYGGMATHGGGAFSGKDPTKVDRSAAYMARYIAKNIVASGIAKKCTIQFAYAIGVTDPISISLWTDNTSKYADEKMGSVGIPVPGVELKIIDEEGKEVEQGSPGQIIVRGPQVMKGYYKQPEETAKFIKNGWFYTGDLGSIDEDGFVYHLGRADEVIITGGLNVYPAEVENALLGHDNIMEAAVLGINDEMRGKVLSAFVVKRLDSDISEKDVIKFMRFMILKEL